MPTCARCHEEKSADQFYSYSPSWCKECRRSYERGRRPRRPASAPDGHKKCPTCEKILPLSEFRTRRDGRPYAYCRPCQRADNERRRKVDVQRRHTAVRKSRGRGIRPSTTGQRGPLGSRWASWRTTGVKWCRACDKTKSISEFWRNRSSGKPHAWCRECQGAAHDKWIRTPAGRAAQKRGAAKVDRHKRAVRLFTYAAIRLGILVCRPCEVCGKTKVEAHHDDYDKPLDVRWLCKDHHEDITHARRRTTL